MLVRLDPIILMFHQSLYRLWDIRLIPQQVYQQSKTQSNNANSILCELVLLARVRLHLSQPRQQVKPDDHSEVVPLLPIPNRTVKRLCANDSAGSRVKVGHRQASMLEAARHVLGSFFFKDCYSFDRIAIFSGS